jgi:hypothetical protein
VAAGSSDGELVSFIDLAPTALALAGLPVPAHMQGRVVLGPRRAAAPPYVFAAADRNDEAPDRIRLVRDARWAYVRNHRPDLPYGQPIAFRDNLATMQEIFRLHDEGRLSPPADWYFRQKPVEELYDTAADPYQVDNLAARPEQQQRLARMRAAHDRWVTRTGDLGAIPEAELAEHYWPSGRQPVTAPPVIEPAGATSPAPIEVTIRSDVEGASLAYTLDTGVAPRWTLYTGAVVIAASATLRARAVRYGWAESAESSASFIVAGDESVRPPGAPRTARSSRRAACAPR